MTDEMTRAQWRTLLRLFRRFVQESGVATDVPVSIDNLIAEFEVFEDLA